jgi:hypothetical protein
VELGVDSYACARGVGEREQERSRTCSQFGPEPAPAPGTASIRAGAGRGSADESIGEDVDDTPRRLSGALVFGFVGVGVVLR